MQNDSNKVNQIPYALHIHTYDSTYYFYREISIYTCIHT